MLKLRELRVERRATQQQLSEYLGVSRPTYTRYECGVREPSLEIIQKVASFFNVTVDYILGINENRVYNPQIETSQNKLMPFCELDAMDIDICECVHSLSDADKMAVIKYIDYIKQRNRI